MPKKRSSFSHYLPRLKREFYLADAVVFWTLPIAHRTEAGSTFGEHAKLARIKNQAVSFFLNAD